MSAALRSNRTLLLSLGLIFGGGLLAWLVQTGIGSISVEDIRFETALTYFPLQGYAANIGTNAWFSQNLTTGIMIWALGNALISTYFFRLTGHVYLGASINGLFLTWLIVAGQATHYAY